MERLQEYFEGRIYKLAVGLKGGKGKKSKIMPMIFKHEKLDEFA